MSSKHTPGPWTQGTSNTGQSCVWLDGHTEPEDTMGPDNTWIDCVTGANARLIAAAPELLEALQNIIESVDKGNAAILCPLAAAARSAITKATGGAT